MSNEQPAKVDGRGGGRPGAGRPKLAEPTRKFQVHLTDAEQQQVRAVKALILKALADAKH